MYQRTAQSVIDLNFSFQRLICMLLSETEKYQVKEEYPRIYNQSYKGGKGTVMKSQCKKLRSAR